MIIFFFLHDEEFWKKVPPNEPYRVVLGEVRDRLYQTRERSRHLLSNGYSDIPEEATFTNVEEVHPLLLLSCTFPLTQLGFYYTVASYVFLLTFSYLTY